MVIVLLLSFHFGVLDALRLIQMWLFRYGVLLPEDDERKDPLSISVSILRKFDILPEMYQVGYTKLYFWAGQVSLLVFLSF